MKLKVGDKVRVRHEANMVWGNGQVCEVIEIFKDGAVSIRHPKNGIGAFFPVSLELAYPLGEPPKEFHFDVRCNVKLVVTGIEFVPSSK